mmetsp:Transcript_5347/g.8129  ORF Transcript_5347/g.8129 Transcript_5347/m.8129 type:complete len:86 (-) Transcript_5347:238-495(-)
MWQERQRVTRERGLCRKLKKRRCHCVTLWRIQRADAEAILAASSFSSFVVHFITTHTNKHSLPKHSFQYAAYVRSSHFRKYHLWK